MEIILSGVPDILSVQAAPDIISKQVRIQAKLGHTVKKGKSKVSISVSEAKSGKPAGSITEWVVSPDREGDETIVDVKVPVQNCRFWSPEDPFLYNLKVTTDGDEYQTRFGMREFRLDTVTALTMLNGLSFLAVIIDQHIVEQPGVLMFVHHSDGEAFDAVVEHARL